MGLGSGERGAKRVCMRLCNNAFSRHEQVVEFLKENDRSRVATVRDGNVMLMGLPKNVQKFEEIVSFVENSLGRALTTTRVLVVTFDNPAYVPDTKGATQSKRDATSKSDQSMQTIVNDFLSRFPNGCSFQELSDLPNCQPLIKSRRTRYVLFDAIMAATYRRIMAWNVPEDVNRMALLLEGFDLRGALRPLDEASILAKRTATHAMINRCVFDHMGWEVSGIVQNIGEADLKLRAYAHALGQHTPLFDTVLLDTIDTDILPIMILQLCTNDQTLQELLALRQSPDHHQTVHPFPPPSQESDPPDPPAIVPDHMLMGDIDMTLLEEADGSLQETEAEEQPSPLENGEESEQDELLEDVVNQTPTPESPESPESPVRFVIAIKERGTFACNELQRTLAAQGRTPYSSSTAGWLMIDLRTLVSDFLRTAPGVSDATQARVFLHLICYGWAVDGCDFVTPAYSDVEPLMAIFGSLFRTPMGKRQKKLQSVVDPMPSETTVHMLHNLTNCAYSHRFIDDQRIQRALWTILYWKSSGNMWPAPEEYSF